MKIAVIGTGYVGLVTGTCFAESGNEVLCMDIDPEKVAAMQAGKVPIYEPQLENLFARNLRDKRLNFTTDLALAVDFAEIIFLALPTPSGEDGSADLSYVLGVAEKIAPLLKKYTVIVNKSTVPVGTAKKVFEVMKNKANASFDVISNPEFLREGFAVEDFMKPDRIVIGTSSALAQEKMRKLYAPFVRQGNPILFMDEKSAEITKYAANAFLATKITFMNEIANYCETVGADVEQVRQGMGTDTRIGKRFLFAGIGYGGSCFPKDVKALIKSGKEVQMPFEIASAVEKVNQSQKTLLAQYFLAHYRSKIN
jgi:UDPglucose 6-dehydrogenase